MDSLALFFTLLRKFTHAPHKLFDVFASLPFKGVTYFFQRQKNDVMSLPIGSKPCVAVSSLFLAAQNITLPSLY